MAAQARGFSFTCGATVMPAGEQETAVCERRLLAKHGFLYDAH
jgi:hypothetical protein